MYECKMPVMCTTALLFLTLHPSTGHNLWATYQEGMSNPVRSKTINIMDYHAVPDGKTLNTKAVLAAISDASQYNARTNNSGVNLYFPNNANTDSNNVYLTAPFNMTSSLTLTIQHGATLQATDDPTRWPVVPFLPSYGSGRDHPGPRRAPFIGGLHLSDVVITGGGTIDGQGQYWWARHRAGTEEKYTRGRLIEFLWTDGILLDHITLINSPFWTVHPTYSTNVVARGLTILNPVDSPNTDGFDPDSTINVSLVDSYFSVGDDGVAIKSGWDCFGMDVGIPTANVHIRNLTVNSPSCAGVCIGSEMSGGVENVLVEECQFLNVSSGLRIKAALGRGGYVRNVTYRNIDIDNAIGWAIQANDFYGSSNKACHGREANAVPKISDLRFENITAHGTGNGANFVGLSTAFVRGVVLSNVTLLTQGKETYTCNDTVGKYDAHCSPRPCRNFVPE